MSHPYEQMPPRAFWRKTVSAQAWTQLDFKPGTKFKLTPAMKIATAGSCFAQHMARRLEGFGLSHWVVEQPPAGLTAERARELQYGVFSARYANVYTVRQLRQLVEFAFGLREGDPPVLAEGARLFDGLRPRIQPGGYDSLADLRADRAWHLAQVKRLFSECDVFVFTLGLTEAWVEQGSGIVFPVCPGTAAGEFDPARHTFVNFDYPEILADLEWVQAFVAGVNPGMRWIVTVSPVPLVATATGQPVLVASTYSKAVLRAVAGRFADAHAEVDYFPSFEIIASAQSFGQYLEGDLREVSPRGVDHVMRQFAASFVEAGAKPAEAAAPTAIAASAAAAAQVECEELLNDRP
ncbi:GSCFA domain-containing protein [Roseateles sp.]|uniref:GSCFA domain-containing protein n=1 Tax=Roseateles sp. TaxID=1971397 RepID=UPI002DFE68C8|nr:GSCFA domain-containing protein [Roseateles sp.]